MQWIILGGILLLNTTPIPLAIGVALFALTTLFSFVTLPVEFDASRRALAWIDRRGIVTSREHAMAKDALWWAAMTYVVAALGSLATLLYYASLLMGRRD
jgi:Zn-dependent membrane protease YugP